MKRARYRSTSTVATLGSALVLLATLGGCGTLYLHSDRAEQDSQASRAAYDKADPKAVFEAERAHLAVLATEENRIVLEQLRAVQYRPTQELVASSAPGSKTAWVRLKGKAEARINMILGGSLDLEEQVSYTPKDPAIGAQVTTSRAAWLSSHQIAINALESEFRFGAARYRQTFARNMADGGAQADPCFELVGAGPRSGKPSAQDPLRKHFRILENQCKNLKDNRAKLNPIFARSGVPDPANAGDWQRSPRGGYKWVQHQIWLHRKAATEVTRCPLQQPSPWPRTRCSA